MPSFFFNYDNDSACPYHRMLMPTRHCSEALKGHEITTVLGQGVPPGHDAYFFHGLANQDGIIAFQKMKKKGAKFVWSLDDDYPSLPEWNPVKPGEDGFACFDILKRMADWIICSTPALASTFNDVWGKVIVCPNLIDTTAFPEVPYAETPDGGRNYQFSVSLPIKVVWSGGPTHKEDVAVMADALDRLIDKHGKKVVVVFQGAQAPDPLPRKYLHNGLIWQPSVPFPAYQSVLNSIEPDVYLAPLAKVPFNLSKSNLRIMEGWALMAPPVATDWGEYGCVQNGVDGRLAANTEEWYSALNRMVTDHEYRLALAAAGRQRIDVEYSWQNPTCRRPWVEAFTRIAREL